MVGASTLNRHGRCGNGTEWLVMWSRHGAVPEAAAVCVDGPCFFEARIITRPMQRAASKGTNCRLVTTKQPDRSPSLLRVWVRTKSAARAAPWFAKACTLASRIELPRSHACRSRELEQERAVHSPPQASESKHGAVRLLILTRERRVTTQAKPLQAPAPAFEPRCPAPVAAQQTGPLRLPCPCARRRAGAGSPSPRRLLLRPRPG